MVKLYPNMKHYETYSVRMAAAYLIGAQYFATGTQQLNVKTCFIVPTDAHSYKNHRMLK